MYNYPIVKFSFKLLLLVCLTQVSNAQEDDFFKELDSLNQDVNSYQSPAFKALQIGNLQSTKVVGKDDLYFVVAHRFGRLDGGIKEFFGLDQANTKIQLSYGILDKLQLGISRDSYEKTYSGTAKFSLKEQTSEIPYNMVLYGSVDINTLLSKNTYPGLLFFDRFAYTSQLLVSRRFSEKLSLEVAPIYARQNLVDLNYAKTNVSVPGSSRNSLFPAPHNQFVLATGGRYKIAKRLSLNMEYAYNLSKNGDSLYKNPLTIGMDIDTGGHVFQLLFTNARGSNDSVFLTETFGDWLEGEVSFGFNIVRVF